MTWFETHPSSRKFVSSPPIGYKKYAVGHSLDGSSFDSYENDLGDRVSVRRKNNPKKTRKLGWTKHTEYHWSMQINGERVDYYPTKGTVYYMRETHKKIPCIKQFIKSIGGEI